MEDGFLMGNAQTNYKTMMETFETESHTTAALCLGEF